MSNVKLEGFTGEFIFKTETEAYFYNLYANPIGWESVYSETNEIATHEFDYLNGSLNKIGEQNDQ